MSDNAYSPLAQSPGLVKTIAVLTLINGIVNIFWGIILTGTVVVPTFGIALLCLPLILFTLLPTFLGVFEAIYSTKLLSDPPQPVRPSTTIAILEIICLLFGNVFSMVVGILALVFYNDPQVKDYFTRLNGIPYPVAPEVPVSPAPPTAPEPAPAEVIPEAPSAPKPKKPGTRKVATKESGTTPDAEAGSGSKGTEA